MSILLAILGFGRSALQAIMAWLSRRSLAEIGCIVLALFAGVQTLRLQMSVRHSRKVEQQLAKCADAQRRLIQQSEQKQKQVGQSVDHYIRVEVPIVKKEVERVESAPLKGNCQTPDAVRSADV